MSRARIEKSRGNGARKDPDDAVRLRDLDATLFQRWGDRHGAVLEAEDRSNAERLRRLGLASGERGRR
jgi:hypothetical protein